MLALFSNGQPHLKAEIIRKILLPLKIMLGLMQFSPVNEGNCISDHMYMKVFPVLMHSNQSLVIGEEAFAKLLPDIQAHGWGDLLIFMEADHVMSIQPPAVLSPNLLFIQKCLIHSIH